MRMRDRHAQAYADLATLYYGGTVEEKEEAYRRLTATLMEHQSAEMVRSWRSQRRASRQPRERGRFVKVVVTR